MLPRTPALLLAALAAAGLAACTNIPREQKVEHVGQFWQRSDTSSALYVRGLKAQQMLNKDIARCVNDIREQVRMGAIRDAIPGENDPAGNTPDPRAPQGHLAQWDTPQRDGYLYAEHMDYHDFEGCMLARGWERADNLTPEIKQEAEDTYYRLLTGQDPRDRAVERKPTRRAPADESYERLND